MEQMSEQGSRSSSTISTISRRLTPLWLRAGRLAEHPHQSDSAQLHTKIAKGAATGHWRRTTCTDLQN